VRRRQLHARAADAAEEYDALRSDQLHFAVLGHLANDFDSTQQARPPLVLDPSPRSY